MADTPPCIHSNAVLLHLIGCLMVLAAELGPHSLVLLLIFVHINLGLLVVVIFDLGPIVKYVASWAMSHLVVTIIWIICIRGAILLNVLLQCLLRISQPTTIHGILIRVLHTSLLIWGNLSLHTSYLGFDYVLVRNVQG